MCEWSISNFALEEGATVVDASATLGKFVNDELLHIQERPSRRSDSFVAVEVPEMRDSTLIGSRTKSAVRILKAQWNFRGLIRWVSWVQESYARLFFTTIQHFTEQLLNLQLLGGHSHQIPSEMMDLPMPRRLVQEALKHQPEAPSVGGDFPWLMVPGHFQNLSGTWVRWLPMPVVGKLVGNISANKRGWQEAFFFRAIFQFLVVKRS